MQTQNTIFSAGRSCAYLQKIFLSHVQRYRSKFASTNCGFINSWPKESLLKGWFVKLHADGYQKSHIHPTGWLSGVFYLKTTDANEAKEGAIEFSIHGHDLPILCENFLG